MGRVTAGSDSGYIYKLYGFDYIRELELLQEAGFHPLEVIQAATMNGALTLAEPKGKAPEFGMVRLRAYGSYTMRVADPAKFLVEIVGTDDMKYSISTISAKPGETITIRLRSKGTIPKVAMAHNVVVLKLF